MSASYGRWPSLPPYLGVRVCCAFFSLSQGPTSITPSRNASLASISLFLSCLVYLYLLLLRQPRHITSWVILRYILVVLYVRASPLVYTDSNVIGGSEEEQGASLWHASFRVVARPSVDDDDYRIRVSPFEAIVGQYWDRTRFPVDLGSHRTREGRCNVIPSSSSR